MSSTGAEPAYAPVRRAGDLLFVSGQLGSGTPDVSAQTRQALEAIGSLLRDHGADLADVVKCTVFLDDLGRWPEMNAAFGEVFGDQLPTRSAVGVTLARDALVEIEAIAYAPRD